MYTKTATIVNESGLHARPAAAFVRQAGKFGSAIRICRSDKAENTVNAKSMVLVLSLAACKGSQVTISATGEDEEQAVNTLVRLIESGLEEV